MDLLTIVVVLVCVFWAWFYVSERRRRKLPPGPYPFPIIGNVLQLGPNLHQSLATLSKTHGPIMSVQLGSNYTVVVSSPEIAKQVLQVHDNTFPGRTIMAAAEVHDMHERSMAFLPVGNQWRKTRKIFREQISATHRLDATQGLRREKLDKLQEYVHGCCLSGREVNIGEASFITGLNLVTVTLFSTNFTDYGSDATHDLKETIDDYFRCLGAPNVADFFPVLKRFDPQGLKRKTEMYLGKLFVAFEDIINSRLESRGADSPKKNDILEALLDSRDGKEYELSIEEIKHIIMDMYLGGTHTTSNSVEWAMTELLLNPEKMAIARNELRSIIGENKQVEESDIPKLPYFQAVIKETFRLHPGAPLLVPRRAEHEAEIGNFIVPKDAQLFVNVWAIGRDSRVWANPTSFEPKRFLNSEVDFKGQDFNLLPFGSGKRICPGMPLADRMFHLTLATLIHNFDWKLEAGVKLDTREKFGVALTKTVPLVAIPTKLS